MGPRMRVADAVTFALMTRGLTTKLWGRLGFHVEHVVVFYCFRLNRPAINFRSFFANPTKDNLLILLHKTLFTQNYKE